MMSTTTPDSKRWTHFHSALQLAIQRAAHKWTYDDFKECFALWCKEEPDGAIGVFNTVSRHMEDQISSNCENAFVETNVQGGINILHAVVSEARVRKQRGETTGPDLWREDLNPRAAVRARSTRIMQSEVEKLRATLKALEDENTEIYMQISQNETVKENRDAKVTELLDILDDVYSKWNKLPHDDIGLWTLQAAETLGSTEPP
ncbi:hypothetical protein BJ138DRAFT_536290 [Hygrophoropsis aurantiaca]|uniref:Uncharacterized protein n=1 Tax=Hygrophoropsis aurantiaca TaxID=72124 RepID=A0ACB8AKM7_9AGAM|nr:hypothetical protein BJ138DRAFT_536290 [Hygrophoropsis aurantiaca]